MNESSNSGNELCAGTKAQDSKSGSMNYRAILRLVFFAVTATSVLVLVGLNMGLSQVEAIVPPAAMWALALVYYAGMRRGATEMAELLAWRERLEEDTDEQ